MKIATHCVVCGSPNLSHTPAAMAPFVMHRIYNWTPILIRKTPEADETVVAFPICGAVTCQECGFNFCDMRFDSEEMGRLYENYRDERYVALREKYEPGYRTLNEMLDGEVVSYFDEMEQFILDALPARPRRVLDWGGGNGINTPFKDAEIEIFDISDVAPKFGRVVDEPNPPYDLIVCSNVLEHVSYPRRLLNEIKGYMGKDTALYLEVPKENQTSTFWHEHVNRFDERSLAKLVDVCGLALVNTGLLPPPPHGYEALMIAMCKLKEAE